MEGKKNNFHKWIHQENPEDARKEIETAIRYRADYLKKRRKNI